MARSGEEIRAQMKGTLVLFALQREGKEAAEKKALEMFKGMTADEIQQFTIDWPKEALDAIAETMFNDERFK